MKEHDYSYYRWFYSLIIDSLQKLASDILPDKSNIFDPDDIDIDYEWIKPCLDLLLDEGHINQGIVDHFKAIDKILLTHSYGSDGFDEAFWTDDAIMNNEYWASIRTHAREIINEIDKINRGRIFNAEVNYCGKTVKCILLADFALIESVEKNHLFFKKTYKDKVRLSLVFIPRKHSLKEIIAVPFDDVKMTNYLKEEFVQSEGFTSAFTEETPYIEKYDICGFSGCKFIYENNDFIANVFRQYKEKNLSILYKEHPEYFEIDAGE